MSEEYKVHRVNTKLPEELNNWLDEKSKRTGITKSALIMLAVQASYDQQTMLSRMSDMGEVAHKLDEVINAIQDSQRNDLN